tara:strand:- start:1118 stop:1276 length:159 start_codon:yes stop_codon:yes gene_type:complete
LEREEKRRRRSPPRAEEKDKKGGNGIKIRKERERERLLPWTKLVLDEKPNGK